MNTIRALGLAAIVAALILGCGDSIEHAASLPRAPDAEGAPPQGGEPGQSAEDAGNVLPVGQLTHVPDPAIVTALATSLGLNGFSANGRIQPRGAPTDYYFEYGTTAAYGSSTPKRPLAPRLTAFYRETWDSTRSGFKGGSGGDLTFVPVGGESGGFVHYAEPTGTDYNHADGIGLLHLAQYFYPGTYEEQTGDEDGSPSASFGGRDPDFRDARVRVAVRGTDWVPSGSELLWWAQVDTMRGQPTTNGQEFLYANWAHTGFNLTDALFAGTWQQVDYRLWNDTTQWTYAGTNRELNQQLNRSVYVYTPLDEALSHLDINAFHVLAFVDPYHPPSGAIGFDNLEIAYRNHSLVLPSNGGILTSFPAGSTDDPASLTDGWRNGEGKMWKSGPSPQAPLELVYDFARPVTIERVQLHQHPLWPARDVEVLVSSDGLTWTTVVQDALPASNPSGPNFAFLLAQGLASPARKVKVRVLGGYRPEHWGLGEIEIFGTGAIMETDDDWYRLNADITGLAAGSTYHYRLVALAGGVVHRGDDMTFTVPAATRPEVATGPATRVVASTAKLEGRINTLGAEGEVFFEFGDSPAYGHTTPPMRAGPEITPRTVVGALADLTPGTAVHYRLVVTGGSGTTYGKGLTFMAK